MTCFFTGFEKSEQKSELLREAGNEYAKCGFLQKTLHAYNLALAFAPPDSAALSLAYGNRSVILSRFKNRASESLKDIERAMSTGNYPADKIKFLVDRKSKLVDSILEEHSSKEKHEDGLEDFCKDKIFRLDSANPEIPDAADYVQISSDTMCGRKLMCTKHEEPGR